MIVEKMAERVIEGEKETRDIYSLAIRSIISEINEEYAIGMIKAVYAKLIKGLGGSDEVREECLDILAEIFKRFGSLLLKNSTLVNKDELMRVIPEQLSRDKLSLRKKATNCLGAFAVILNQKQLHQMCLLLIDKIKKSRTKADSFTLIQCFGQMARTVGNKIAQYLNDIFPLLCEFASSLNKESSIDIDNEIAEACMSTFESLVKKCPREIGPYVD
jgi:cullin-associated NEDD8-dissociated protein 1